MTLVVVAHVAIFMAAGYRVAYRTGQLRTAVLVAMSASVIGTLVAVTLGAVGTILFFGGFTQALARLSPLAFVFVLLMISHTTAAPIAAAPSRYSVICGVMPSISRSVWRTHQLWNMTDSTKMSGISAI